MIDLSVFRAGLRSRSRLVKKTVVRALVSVLTMAIAWNCGSDQVGPVVTASVVVTPAQTSAASLGEIISFSAVARDGSGAAIAGATFTWSSSNASVATVDGNGAATAVGNGTTQITATSSGVTGSATLTVTQAAASIEVTPAAATLTAIGERRQFSAEALDANGNPLTTQPAFVWTESSGGVVATINAGGLATAIADGTTQVTASAGGASASSDLTVAQAISSIRVTPAAAVLGSVGDTQQFNAEARDANDYPLGTQPSFIWTSANQAIATVNINTGLVMAVAEGTTQISAAAGGVTGSADLSVAPTAAMIVVTPATASLDAIGSQQQFTAEARDANGNPLPVQPTFVWTESSAGGVATIDATGLATASGNGTTQVTATWGGTSGSASLTVAQAASSILVTPATATLTAIGVTQQFTGVVRDANDHPLANQPSLTWTSTNQAVATVHLTTGLATSHAVGTAQIVATAAGLTGHAELTVTQAIGSIVVTPATATLTALGATQQFSAVALDGVGTPLAVQPSFTWGSSDETVATIDPSTGLATAVALGTTQISASAGGSAGNAVLTVTQPIGSIAVTPAAATLDAVGAQQQFSAVALDGIGTPLAIQPNFTWSSTDETVATVDIATGLATAVANGSAQITASAGGVIGSSNLTVAQAISSVVVTPAVATLDAIGATLQFAAEARDINGNPLATQPAFTWGSANHPVATVGVTSGLATAQGVGIAEISATAGGVIGTAELTVTQAVASIVVTPATAMLDAIGDTQQFSAEARDANGNLLITQPTFTWADNSSGAVATVDGNGLATATGNGTTQISASAGGASGSADLTVSQVMSMISVDPAAVTLTAVGATQQFSAEAQDANGNPMPSQPSFAWASSDEAVATIDAATGLATSQSMGTTEITASAAGFTGSAGLTVTQAISSIVVTPATATLDAIGAEQQFSAEARDAAGTPLAIQPTFTWASGDDAIATVGATTGLATAQGNGTTQISASAGSVTGSADLTVAQTAVSVVVTPDPATMSAIGATLQFSAEAQDANGNALATQPTFAWTENSSGAVATIDGATGLATAVSNGTTQITATGGGVSGNASLTVAQVINAVVVTPDTVTLTAIGATQQYTAEARDINGNPLATQPTFAWTENGSGAVATIDGATGLATAVGNGTTQITATGGGVAGNATLTVAQVIDRIVVTFNPPSPLGVIGATTTASAEAQDANGNALATQPTSFDWISSDEAVATLDPAAGATTTATAVSIGSSDISATADGVTGSATLTVAQTIDHIVVTLNPASPLDAIGATTTVSAEARDASDNPVVPQPASFDWASSDEAVATVDPAAGATTTATAVANGTTQIEATAGGVTGSAPLTVNQTIDQIVVTLNPVGPFDAFGATTVASAEARDANGNPLAPQPTSFDWVSANTLIATVTPAAGPTTTATTVGNGTTQIQATSGGVTGTADLTVAQVATSVAVLPPAATLTSAGNTQQFTAETRDANDSALTTQPTFTWTESSGGTVATIDPSTGLATAVAEGTTTITATASDPAGLAGTATLNVSAVTIVVTPELDTLDRFEHEVWFSAEASDAYGPLDPQPSFTWEVFSNGITGGTAVTITDIDVITPGVKVMAMANGTDSIRASALGVADTAVAVVKQRTFVVEVTPASVNMDIGETQLFSAVAKDENGYDLVTQPVDFAWASTDVAIATVAPDTALTTIATAVANGTVAVTATDTAAGVTGSATVRVGPTTGVFWLGGDGSWNDAGNWSSGTVPTAADDVVIDVGGNYTVYLTAAGSAKSITLGATTGTQTLELDGQDLTVAGTLTIGPNGRLTTFNATVTAALNNQGLWDVYDGSVLSGSGFAHVNSDTIDVTFGDLTINLSGSTFSNEDALLATGGSVIVNGGTFTVTGPNGKISIGGPTFTMNGGTFNYDAGTIDGRFGVGTLALVGATGNFTPGIQTSNVQLDLTDAVVNGPGTITTDHMDVRTYVDNSTINASISNYETIYVSNNTFFAGATTVNSGTGHIYGTGTLDITGTTFTNQGRIDPAGYNGGDPDPSTLTISGNLVQSPSAEIYIDIKDAGVFDVLAVTGSATLSGTLAARQFSGSTFVPTSGQEFVVMTFTSGSGSFTNTTVNVGGATLDIVYTPTSVKLVAQ